MVNGDKEVLRLDVPMDYFKLVAVVYRRAELVDVAPNSLSLNA